MRTQHDGICMDKISEKKDLMVSSTSLKKLTENHFPTGVKLVFKTLELLYSAFSLQGQCLDVFQAKNLHKCTTSYEMSPRPLTLICNTDGLSYVPRLGCFVGYLPGPT